VPEWLVVKTNARLEYPASVDIGVVRKAVARNKVRVKGGAAAAPVKVIARTVREVKLVADPPIVLNAERVCLIAEFRCGVIRVERGDSVLIS